MSTYLTERVTELNPKTDIQFANALKQVLQEVALLGLERGGFFKKAAFCGGTALRLLYGLPRFSEDLNFTLFKPDGHFELDTYFHSLQGELAAYGLETKIESPKKTTDSAIHSAFVKAETRTHLLKIKAPAQVAGRFQRGQLVQIKFEVDSNPAIRFEAEPRALLNPATFELIALKIPDLFAGKMHAILFRAWKNRVKGRDFYDLVWYLKHSHPLRLGYLQEKMEQTKTWNPSILLDHAALVGLFKEKIQKVDFEQAKTDVLPFIQNTDELKVWKREFFNQIIEKIRTLP